MDKIIPAFANTISFKNRISSDFRISPFSHGYAYVAMSRVRHHTHLAMLFNPDSMSYDEECSPKNVVYCELL